MESPRRALSPALQTELEHFRRLSRLPPTRFYMALAELGSTQVPTVRQRYLDRGLELTAQGKPMDAFSLRQAANDLAKDMWSVAAAAKAERARFQIMLDETQTFLAAIVERDIGQMGPVTPVDVALSMRRLS